MAIKKVTSKAAATTASKILSNPRSSRSAKSAAAVALAAARPRTIHSAPKKGTLNLAVIRKSVANVSKTRKK